MTVGDIYYVVFRHKWKIILLSLAGIVAAAVFYYRNAPPYQSQAELLIQYVPEARSLTLPGSGQKVIVPDSGAGIINSEIQILTSLDLAEQAVTNIGAASILANAGGGSNAIAAASLIRGNLQAEPAGNGSSVIVITLKLPDSRIVQPVLWEVINDYFEKHKEIHSAGGGYDDALSREQSTLSVQLNDTEKQLADLKNKANITSLDDARKDLADQISKVKGAILDAQAGLAGYEAAMKQTGGAPPEKLEATTNAPRRPFPRIKLTPTMKFAPTSMRSGKKSRSISCRASPSATRWSSKWTGRSPARKRTRPASRKNIRKSPVWGPLPRRRADSRQHRRWICGRKLPKSRPFKPNSRFGVGNWTSSRWRRPI